MIVSKMFNFCSAPANYNHIRESFCCRKMFCWIAKWPSADFATSVVCKYISRQVQDILAANIPTKAKLKRLRKLRKIGPQDVKRGVYANIAQNTDGRFGLYIGSIMAGLINRIQQHIRRIDSSSTSSGHYRLFQSETGWGYYFIPFAELDAPFDTLWWALLIETVIMIELPGYDTTASRKSNTFDGKLIKHWVSETRREAQSLKDKLAGLAEDLDDAEEIVSLNHCLPTKQGLSGKAIRPTHCGAPLCDYKFSKDDEVRWIGFGEGTCKGLCRSCYSHWHNNGHALPGPEWYANRDERGHPCRAPELVDVKCCWCLHDLSRGRNGQNNVSTTAYRLPELGENIGLCQACVTTQAETRSLD